MDQKEKEVTSEDKNNQTYCSSMIIKQKRILKKHNALLSKPNKKTWHLPVYSNHELEKPHKELLQQISSHHLNH